jgi:HSP20 family protein
MNPSRRRKNPWDDEGGFFSSDFEAEFQKMQDYMKKMMDGLPRMGFSSLEPGKSFVYGFSMHNGPDGKPVFERFGNVPGEGLNQLSPEREPLVEVIPKDDEVTVIAELPGVDKKDIELDVSSGRLSITVDTPARRYHKQLRIPDDSDSESVKASYKNGILEVKISRRKSESHKKIKIE